MPTIAELLGEAAAGLREPFHAGDLLTWFRSNAPAVKESSIRAHIQALTGNATNRIANAPVLGTRPPVLFRLGHGLYRRWRPTDDTTPADGMELARTYLAVRPAPIDSPSGEPALPVTPREEWSWEGNVQAAAIAWLSARGWRIRRVADTGSREHGTDVVAERAGRVLHAEVKGWPSNRYVDPRRATEPKRTNPSVQARVWFADALMHALRLRDTHTGDAVAIVLPDTGTYRGLASTIAASVDRAEVAVLFVDEAGDVTTAGTAGDGLA
jgi:hypothetical protein